MQSTIAAVLSFETSLLCFLRLILFFASRKFLLRSLYHDLQDLSPGTELTAVAVEDASVELDVLPTPSTATPRKPIPPMSSKRTFHSTLSHTLFSLSFSESCTLFLLLMCQGLNVLHPRTRLFNWELSLSVLLATILIFIPLSYSIVLSYGSSFGPHAMQRPSIWRLVLMALPVGLFLFLLSYIPLPQALSSSRIDAKILSRLIVLGVVTLGLLSGFGAVSNAWSFFPLFSRKQRQHLTDDDMHSAEQALSRVRAELARQQAVVQKLQQSQPESESSWLTRIVPTFRGDSQMSGAMQELSGLEALEFQMARNLEALKKVQAESKFSRTFRGKISNWAGRLFALYCVYRILGSIATLVLPVSAPSADGSPAQNGAARSNTDFLAVLLAYLLSLAPSIDPGPDEVAVISRQISLALVGVIILSSIRLVLRGVTRVMRVTSRNAGASLMLLMLAQLMGIYLLSTLIQLRTSFPPPPSRPDTEPDVGFVNLFSTLPEFQFFGTLFDGTFLLAAGVTSAALFFNERINGVGVVHDNDRS